MKPDIGESMNPVPFEQVYDSHYDDIWRYLLHISGDAEVALELTSQTFYRAYRAWPKFNHQAPAKVWLLRIAVNEWRRELRRRQIQRVVPFPKTWWREGGEIECDHGEVETINAEIERNENFLALQRALMRLPEKYRTPIVLKYFEYLSLDEIAAILGRPVGTVKSLVHRGIAKLREDQGLREVQSEFVLEATR
ncbi:MAG: sigma-70 family RNA polymerase sigma factor [Calditrichaeota bacterium]|nr:sigma-70 family RNA polymerase sigma factor [Calditrichota bacterium]MCB9369396.1 sigma-70 family RNA polymerase sigma factor [Calditrichota bacterium]